MTRRPRSARPKAGRFPYCRWLDSDADDEASRLYDDTRSYARDEMKLDPLEAAKFLRAVAVKFTLYAYRIDTMNDKEH